ncbi:MAG: hypothetical protein VB857_11580 [Pirellulaceae bacterium]
MPNKLLLTVTQPSRHWFAALAVALAGLAGLSGLWTVPVETAPPADQKQSSPSIKFPTLGGTQFWTDQVVFHDWRIQRNHLTRHYRLLDSKNYRHTWGSFKHCQETLKKLKTELRLPAIEGKVVIVLHGLGRTRNSMNTMKEYLQKHSNYTVLSMSYASTRADVQDHAQSLAQVIKGIPQAKEISFVAHSLGNLVIRRYLHNAKTRKVTGPTLGSIVMLAPPNQGSAMARRLKDSKLIRTVWGPSGDEIASHWPTLSRHLAVPGCPFGILAGKSEKTVLDNPLITGGDDLVVTVAETRLAGARDFLVVPAVHTYLMDHPQVHRVTLHFLEHGYFQSESKRQPIKPASPKKP